MTAMTEPARPLLSQVAAEAPEAPATDRVSNRHRVRVTLDNGMQLEVEITNRERLAWDKTAPRHKWGAAKDVPFLAGTFMAYAAAKRAGEFVGKWEAWEEAVISLEDVEDQEDDVITPTRKAAGPTS